MTAIQALPEPTIIKDPVLQVRGLSQKPSYGFASTEGILQRFAEAGWEVASQQTISPRKQERVGFQRHLVRLRHKDYALIPGLAKVNDTVPELVVMNSHDCSTSLRLTWGMLRLICLNGMVTGRTMQEVRLSHSKTPIEKRLPVAIGEMVAAFPRFVEQVQRLEGKTLSAIAVEKLVRVLYDARLANVQRLREVDYTLPGLRRQEDDGTDAFRILNRLQECLMRGGISYTYDRAVIEDGKIVGRKVVEGVTRRLGSLDMQVRLNRLAYDSVMEVAS